MNSPRRSTARSRASASTAFPNRTRRASRCWCMSRPGSSATSRRPSCSACSMRSRWVSIRPRNWCRTRAATASRCGRWMSRPALGEHAGRRDGLSAVRLGLQQVRGFAAAAGARIVAARAARRLPISPTWPGARNSAGATSTRWPPPAPCATRRAPPSGGLGRRRGAAAARPVRRRRAARGRRHLCRAARGRGDRRRLPQPRPHAGRHPLALLRARLAAKRYLRPWSCAPRRSRRGALRGARHLPPAAGHRQRRHLRHAGGRNRLRQRRGVQWIGVSPAPTFARQPAIGRRRPVAGGRRGRACRGASCCSPKRLFDHSELLGDADPTAPAGI
jgi:hypothetical protein